MDKQPDWKAIEAEYRACEWSLRDIAERHGVTVAEICERAKDGNLADGGEVRT